MHELITEYYEKHHPDMPDESFASIVTFILLCMSNGYHYSFDRHFIKKENYGKYN
jgi:hypothetical protein